MAVLSQITCTGCGVRTHVSHRPGDAPPQKCGACRKRDLDALRKAHFDELATMPMEERLRRVEEWIYDYKPHVPLSEMRF